MIDVVTLQESITVKPNCDIVAEMANGFKDDMGAVVAQGISHLVIDLQDVEMIDSIGLGVLIGIHNKLRENGGSLTVKNLSEDILALFRTMRLNKHFEVLGQKAS